MSDRTVYLPGVLGGDDSYNVLTAHDWSYLADRARSLVMAEYIAERLSYDDTMLLLNLCLSVAGYRVGSSDVGLTPTR